MTWYGLQRWLKWHRSSKSRSKSSGGSSSSSSSTRSVGCRGPLGWLPHERCIRRLAGGAIKSRQQTDRQSPLPAAPNTRCNTLTRTTLTAAAAAAASILEYLSLHSRYLPSSPWQRVFLTPFPFHFLQNAATHHRGWFHYQLIII